MDARRVGRRGVLLALVLAASGCLSTTQRREDTLVRTARMFNDDWRWARWDAMTSSMTRDDAAAFRKRVEAIEDELVLSDYEVTSVTFATGSQTATVVARFEWYYKRDPRVRVTTVEQKWEHQDGGWQVVGLRRARGERFGLVTEPIASPPAEAAASAPPTP
jgi:uncharacterized protein involved in type VI secretion and phage assembly